MEHLTEREYRRVRRNSSSSLKDFSLDRRKYHRRYILGEAIKEKPDKASNMGRLVETLLMESERFDEEFFMTSLPKIPGGMLGDFIYILSEKVSESIQEHETITDEKFEECARAAHKSSGFKIKFETIVKKLEDPENQLYYDECLKVNHLNMTMVSPQDIENAEQIVNELKNNSATGHIVTLESNDRFEVINQMKVTNFTIMGMPMKAMLDKVIVDHQERKIKWWDLKCTWSVEKFYKEYYLYRRTYIQAYVYFEALQSLTDDKDSSFYGYTVELPKFMVCDSINYYSPLIYTLSGEDLEEAVTGFEYKGTQYPGVAQIIEDLRWAIEEDEWAISKVNFEKGGVLNIKDIS